MSEASARPLAAVIGVGPGLGTALARRFAEHYTVAIVARKADYLEQVAGEIKSAGGTVLPVAADVSDQAALAEAFATIRKVGNPEILIYNAAMRPFGTLMETKAEHFREYLAG